MRHRSEPLISNINVTAFLSVMVALLFLIMPNLSDVDRFEPSVDWPTVNHPVSLRGARREDALIITLTRDGKIYLGRVQMPMSEIPPAILAGLSHGAERKVYINADAHARYGIVREALAAVLAAGIENVGILARQRKP